MEKERITIAVLMTCHNRKDTTLKCLTRLYKQELPQGVSFKVFLVDDGCTDGTGDAVEAAYPDIQVIQGDGSLFWCNGMRLAWQHAAKEDFDFYLWLNDDTMLLDGAVERLLSCWLSVVRKPPATINYQLSADCGEAAIIVGSCCDPETGVHTYGGKRRLGRHPSKFSTVLPEDVPVECDTFQGNVVLIPHAVYMRIGNLNSFRHAIGDTDYGLRAKAAGCEVIAASGWAGTCSANQERAPAELSFTQRWKVMMRRLPPTDYYRFLREHVGWRWPVYWPRPYINLFLCGTKRRECTKS